MPPKNQHPNEEMGTLITQGILKGRGTNDYQIHDEVFNFPGYKIDVNQNCT
jgi:hypothetical protein